MKYLIIIICLILSFPSNGQVYYRQSEFGIGGGASNYFGDLNQDYSFADAKYSANLFYKYNFTPYISMKAMGSFGQISFDDKLNKNEYQRLRNLNFKNNIYEFSVIGEFNFFEYNIEDLEHRFTPFISLGMGMFFYNPYTTYLGKKTFLRPLGTEGQGYSEYKNRVYTTTALSFPIGAGFKFWLSKGMTLNFDVIHRITTTDYIDDVSATYVGIAKFQNPIPSPYPLPAAELQDRSIEISNTSIGIEGKQRGISSTRDQFMFIQLGISYRLPTYRCPSR
jgi:hypothetical protein